MAYRSFPAVVFACVCLLLGDAWSAAAQTPALNGVMVNPVDPGKSMAIIDGRRMHVGSRWQGLELAEIGEGFVRLRESADGRQTILTMGAHTIAPVTHRELPTGWNVASGRKSASATLPATIVVPRTRAVRVNLTEVPEPEFLERINPLRLVWMAYTAMAQASLRQIHTAQQLFAINDLDYDGSDQYSGSLAELADHRLVQIDLAGGEKFGYHFAVRAWEDKLGPHFECIAEPVRADTRQPYMYLDESGVIRGQLFARAGFDSPPIN